MIPNPCIEVQTSPENRFSVPPWFAEVVILTQHLAAKKLLEAFAHQVRLVRGRFGSYEVIDFLALLIGYAVSGDRLACNAWFGPPHLHITVAGVPAFLAGN